MSELKCCKRCGAFVTCTTKGECCPECEYFDPIDNLCMAIPESTKSKEIKSVEPTEIDPETFLFEDDDEDDEDLSDLPDERESDDDEDDEDFGFDDDDW